MPIYNVEIRVIHTYQVEGVRAKDEDTARERAVKKFQKDPKKYFDDEQIETEAHEI